MMSLMAGKKAGLGLSTGRVAAIAAALAGIGVFLVPAHILDQAALTSGAAELFAPLAPPLGMKARIGLALVAAGTVFGMVVTLLRLLGLSEGKGTGKASGEPAAETAAESEVRPAPRVRRRDAHPDAPVRAPLSAARDLGDPDEPLELVTRADPRQRPSLADILAAPPPAEQAPAKAPAPAAEPAAEPVADPAERLRRIRRAAVSEERAEEAPAAAEPDSSIWAQPPIAPEPEASSSEPVIAQNPEPQPEPESEPELNQAPLLVPAPSMERRGGVDRRRPVLAEAAPARPTGEGEESVADLLARFERALSRRTAEVAARPIPDDAVPADEGTDARLRSALENLKRFAPRAG